MPSLFFTLLWMQASLSSLETLTQAEQKDLSIQNGGSVWHASTKGKHGHKFKPAFIRLNCFPLEIIFKV